MAVSSKESQKNIQSLLDQGVSQDFLSQQKYGPKLNPTEAGNILNSWKTNSQGVYSTTNIANPTPPPDDLMNIRSTIQDELGIPKLQSQFQDIYGKLQAFDTGTDQLNQQYLGNVSGMENQPISMNVIRGEQAELGRQEALKQGQRGVERGALARQAQVAQDALLAARQEATERFGIRSQEVQWKRNLILENPQAGITFGDSLESMASKIQNANQLQKIESLKLQYPQLASKITSKNLDKALAQLGKGLTKSQLKEQYAKIYGVAPKGLSTKAMEKMIKKYFKEELSYNKEKRDIEMAQIKNSLNKSKLGSTSVIPNEVMAITDDEYTNFTGSSGQSYGGYDYGSLFGGQSYATPGVDY